MSLREQYIAFAMRYTDAPSESYSSFGLFLLSFRVFKALFIMRHYLRHLRIINH